MMRRDVVRVCTGIGAAICLAQGAAAAGGAAPGFNAVRDFPHPTAFQSQPVPNLGGGVRPPIPTGFRSRRLGAGVSAANIGVQQVIVARDPRKMTWTVRFADGTEAPFIDRRDTLVGTTAYRGIGYRGGAYVVQNLQTREYVKFPWPATPPAAPASPVNRP